MTRSLQMIGHVVAAVVVLLIATPTDDHPNPPAAMRETSAVLTVVLENGGIAAHGPADPPLRDAIVALVAALRSGRATVTASSIEVTGIASAHGGWEAALRTFRNRLPAGLSLETDVLVVDDALDVDDLCARMFGRLADPRIEFRQASNVLRTASHAALDRLINFSRNCTGGVLLITGHSDAVGGAEFNLGLSRRRAAAVAAYLQSGGVPMARLRIEGKGAAEPVADNGTASGRARNRRIEFALLPQTGP